MQHLEATTATTMWGRLPCGLDEPILTVDAGEQLSVDTISHEGILEDQGRDPIAFFGGFGVAPNNVLIDTVALATNGVHDLDDGPHVISGPIEVRGARVGDYIAVHFDELLPRTAYGIISSRHGKGSLPALFPRNGAPLTSIFSSVVGLGSGVALARATLPLRSNTLDRAIEFPIRPFLGVVGVATPDSQRLHSTPPGEHGGNIDIALLTQGSTLYLPVQVAGAGLYLGDPHFAQGNGEVALTALEAPLRVTITVDVITRASAASVFGAARGPIARTSKFLIPTGLDVDLDEAVTKCCRNAIEILTASFNMDADHAYAYLSAATDFEVSQVVDIVKGAHACINVEHFAGVKGNPW